MTAMMLLPVRHFLLSFSPLRLFFTPPPPPPKKKNKKQKTKKNFPLLPHSHTQFFPVFCLSSNNPHLACTLQRFLVLACLSSEEPDLHQAAQYDEWHEGDDEQRELPAVDERDDNGGAHVGNVHQNRPKTHTSYLGT